MTSMIQINPADNVAVALHPIAKGESLSIGGITVSAVQEIPQGHKMALKEILAGADVIKYGYPIGHAVSDIHTGEWVHVHNLKTNLSEETEYTYAPVDTAMEQVEPETFMGFLRADGRAAVRNELWILPTVGCVNSVVQRLTALNQHLVAGSVEGLYAFPHPYGCSQMGDDHITTRRLLAALARHPNAGGVLVVGLGCENNTMEEFQKELGSWDDNRIKFMVCQEVEDEIVTGSALLAQLAEYACGFKRQPLPVSKLVVGMKCGGSDGLSGITANPTVGVFSDMLTARGGSTVLTEVPEMFGAESLLMQRCVSREVYDKAVDMITGFKQYFTDHGQVVYENPSPGNKQGGISTLEDKSLGCVQKGGRAQVVDVISYGGQVTTPGLNLLWGPGNDLVSSTALVAAGAHIVLFTTGRGTPFGAPAPTVKVSTNSQLFAHKSTWLDFNAGTVAEGEPITDTAKRLLDYVIKLSSGEIHTCAEQNGYREISIFKDGVIL
ncbi:altronate dehydratase family protein [Oscillospiraceae bacterium PP1C4]